MTEKACHEASAHILERQRRPVEELQHMNVGPDLEERHGKTEGRVHQGLQIGRREVVGEQVSRDYSRHLGAGLAAKTRQERRRQRRELLGQVEAPIRGDALEKGRAQVGCGTATGSAH